MITVTIDETKPTGRRFLKELAKEPTVASIHPNNIDVSKCKTWKEASSSLLGKLTEHYDSDFTHLANEL